MRNPSQVLRRGRTERVSRALRGEITVDNPATKDELGLGVKEVRNLGAGQASVNLRGSTEEAEAEEEDEESLFKAKVNWRRSPRWRTA